MGLGQTVGAWIAPEIAECPDCGLSTEPLRALALMAANQLKTAATLQSDPASAMASSAADLVPESENFLLDAGRALTAAGAYEDSRRALDRASRIAPGRKDIKAELGRVSEQIDPTAWLAEAPMPTAGTSAVSASTRTESTAKPVLRSETARESLMHEHAAARQARDQAELSGEAYVAACLEVARVEVAIAGLSA